ncbi:hypothetical protein PVK06_026323 [Gossypium arboreum]|uniref:Uncharacterized protein n=1 Tax=Gossypium arboreum TaxID=29729 RepID=A0ABR0NXD9_GOSAR|nr:hypothetical protein PVK06_026323 [Gossypium arboreum]
MKSVINEYKKVSGQLVNFDKSLIYFSSNVGPETQIQVGGILGVRISNNSEKYLGLPTIVGQQKKHAFVHIKERFLKLLNNWSLRFLLTGGKEVFLKSILQAILIYAMQCFKLSASFCLELESIMSKFWWQNSKTNKGIHWCKWSDLCIPKANGGLGFRDLEKFNLAMLAKQGWKIITQPHCLFARVMKAKYFPRGDFLSAGLGSYPSFTWQSIWSARQILEDGIGWRVGNGESINIWSDSWVPIPRSGRVQCQNIDIRYTTLSDLIDKDTITWKQDTIRSLFGEEQLKSILSIPLVSSRSHDQLIWRGDNIGEYTVKSGYKWINATGNSRLYIDRPTSFYTKP